MQQIKSKRFTTDAVAFGTYLIPPGSETYAAVTTALEVGYRSVDTAWYYQNEKDVGRAVRDAGLEGTVQITTKVWNDFQGYQSALDAGRKSRDTIGFKAIDLLLIHWPGANKFIDTWKAFEKLKAEGTVKYIGVSNFNPKHLEALKAAGMETPVINQIEMSPLLTQQAVRDYCAQHDILVEAWGPIVRGNVELLEKLAPIAVSHGKSAAQVALKWAVQRGCRVLPKSVRRERMVENLSIFDFTLTDKELAFIDGMNADHRSGPNPEEFLF